MIYPVDSVVWAQNLKSRGVGTQQSFIRGGSAPPFCPLPFFILLCTIFDRKVNPFVDLLQTNDTPFTYLVWNFATLLTVVNALPKLPYKCKCITKPERFLHYFTAIKYTCYPFLAILKTEMTDFPTSSTSTSEIPFLSDTWNLKKIPLLGGTSAYRNYPRVYNRLIKQQHGNVSWRHESARKGLNTTSAAQVSLCH